MSDDFRTPEYCIWSAMKSRCLNKNGPSYDQVGGRGIRFAERWESFKPFLNDMGERPDAGMILTRLDPDGDFTPENCIWANYGVAQHHDKPRCNNTTGTKGVCRNRKNYQAVIYVDAKKIHLGTFATIDEAAAVRSRAEKVYW